MKVSTVQCSPFSSYLVRLRPKYLPPHPILEHPQSYGSHATLQFSINGSGHSIQSAFNFFMHVNLTCYCRAQISEHWHTVKLLTAHPYVVIPSCIVFMTHWLKSYSKLRAKSNGDKASPCVRACLIGNVSDKFFASPEFPKGSFKHTFTHLTTFIETPHSTIQNTPRNWITGFIEFCKYRAYCPIAFLHLLKYIKHAEHLIIIIITQAFHILVNCTL